MGKIDKEKLLKEIESRFINYKTLPELDEVEKVIIAIKNFPEEPEIDFDALLEERKIECNKGCNKSEPCKTCFVKFLKSKRLTTPQIDMDQLRNEVYSEIVKNRSDEKSVCKWCNESVNKCDGCKDYSNFYAKSKPKPFEIPVKKTWTLKKEFEDFVNENGVVSMKDTSMLSKSNPRAKYYDCKEEPDYSKIPKGSIVEFTGENYRKISFVEKDSLGRQIFVCGIRNGIHDKWDAQSFIRVVELAKE